MKALAPQLLAPVCGMRQRAGRPARVPIATEYFPHAIATTTATNLAFASYGAENVSNHAETEVVQSRPASTFLKVDQSPNFK